MRSPSHSFIADLLKRIAPRIGAKVVFEPEHQHVGYIQFKNGARSFFRDNRFSLNEFGSVKLAQDKSFCRHFLARFGYTVPREITFWKPGRFKRAKQQRTIREAIAFANKVRFPVFVKPNNRSQGIGVEKAHDAAELRKAASAVFAISDVAIVQKAYDGTDVRIVVLDGEVISAYERRPLHVTGDGKSTIADLVAIKQNLFHKQGRDTTIRIDARVRNALRRQNLTLKSVLPPGKTVRLLHLANLSTGGDAIDITNQLHPDFRNLASAIARDLRLRFCGVDLIASDVTRPHKRYVVLEVNSAPGLDHYLLDDPKRQEALVDELYLRVLRAVEKTCNPSPWPK